METIAYVDVSKTGLQPLAEAVLARWEADGTKPDVDRDGDEIVALARVLWRERNPK